MTDNSTTEQLVQLNNIKEQLRSLGQAVVSMRDVPNSLNEVNKRLETLEKKIQEVTLDELDDMVAGLQYASLKTERAALLTSKWKPSFILGVLVICGSMFAAYYFGLKQGVPEKRALVQWAEQFRTPNQRDLAEWTLREEESASIASKTEIENLKWINSSEAEYARKFFKINAYLLAGDCPKKSLVSSELNGRPICTVWKVEP